MSGTLALLHRLLREQALVLGVMFARIGRRDGLPWFRELAETTLARACPA